MSELTTPEQDTIFDAAANGWKRWPQSGIGNLVGEIWTRREEDRWAYGFFAEERHRNAQGVVHGGVLMTFADQCVGLVAWEAAQRTACMTVQLNTHFVAAASVGSFIEGRAQVIRVTRSMIFLRGDLTTRGKQIVAVDGIWKRLNAE